ncbi:hypothetical protein LOAG_18524 [Loa loa]|uniref:START domain-containing protein n=1 Tax=Loa loa TaxID=7209 RepID=A0A1S0UEW2_LOALO|nr:hypothetical protein LOAG_18524 [Loa loa]EJD74115.1 hypothetical protein LOAG_18524 [Loa loa]
MRCRSGKEAARITSSTLRTEMKSGNENYPGIAESPPKDVTLPASNPFATEINHIAMEQLKYARSVIYDDAWQLFMEEDEMKMYKRELEINGIVYDPLKAVHLVQAWQLFMEEDEMKMYKRELEINGIVYDPLKAVHLVQLHKRIWPSAQRESLFWSNVRYLPEEKSPEALDLYMVCNHDCSLPNVPLQHNSNVRVGLTVAMLCETVVKDGHEKPVDELDRGDIQCQVCYCAQVNPGGWVPVAALRVIYKREYPRFLHGFTKYVLNKIKAQPLMI